VCAFEISGKALLVHNYGLLIKKNLTRKSSGGHQARKRKKGRKNLSPRNRNITTGYSYIVIYKYVYTLFP
jgi:hypothetical protein